MKSAFTLIELLVVIAIITILSGLLMSGAFMMRTRAKMALTVQRISTVHSGLAHAASERELVAVLFAAPVDLDSDPGMGPANMLATPFGAKTPNGTGVPIPATAVNLRNFNPARSLDLLFYASTFSVYPDRRDAIATASNLATALTAYDNDRSAKQPWNDAWGQPLVVAYGVYDAGTSATSDSAFGYRRSITASVGSAGEKAAGTGTATARLSAIWTQVNNACNMRNNVGLDRWQVTGSTNAFTTPPWAGVEQQKDKPTGSRCSLSAPQEYR